MPLCGQMIPSASKGTLGLGKMHNINHINFELPAKKVKSQIINSQGQEAGDALEKVSLLPGQK